MAKLVLLNLLALWAFAATWTGKLDKVYDLSQLNLHYEGIHYYDGDLYTGTVSGKNIFRFDPDDFSTSSAATVDKVGDNHNAGNQVLFGLCSSSSKDRIYGALGSFSGTELGGIAYWNDKMEFQKAYTVTGQALVNDCVVKGDYVYFTGSRSGPSVMACDLDLDSCSTIYSGSLLSPTTSVGANGIVYMDDFLIVAQYDDGRLVKVPVKDGQATTGDVANVSIVGDILDGADGLVRIDDDVIIVVTSQFVSLVESSDKWVTASVKRTIDISSIEASGASTAALKSDDKEEIEIYVAFPSWASWQAGVDQTLFKLAKIKFSDEDVDDLDFSAALVAAVMLWFA